MITIENAVYLDLHAARFGLAREPIADLSGIADLVARADGQHYLALGIESSYRLSQILARVGSERPSWARLFHPEESAERRERGRMGEIRLEGRALIVILTDRYEGPGYTLPSNEIALYRA